MSKSRRISALAGPQSWEGKECYENTSEGSEKLDVGHLNSSPEERGQARRVKPSWMGGSQQSFLEEELLGLLI